MDWTDHYPAFAHSGKYPEFADVGCGFGGLLIALAPLFPDTLMLGWCAISVFVFFSRFSFFSLFPVYRRHSFLLLAS